MMEGKREWGTGLRAALGGQGRGEAAPPLRHARWWRGLDVMLALFIIGPIVAPFFMASRLWLFERIATWFIYGPGLWICPQEQHALPLIGHEIMAVCTRCYAAIGGMLAVRLALTSDPAARGLGPWLARMWRRVPMGGRTAFIVAIIALWQADVRLERLGWFEWNQLGLILTGPIVGLAVGFLGYGLAAALLGRRAAWD